MQSGRHHTMFEIDYYDYKQVSIGIERPIDYYKTSLHDADINMIREKYPHEWCDDNKTNILICHNTGVIIWKGLLEQKCTNANRVTFFRDDCRTKRIGVTL